MPRVFLNHASRDKRVVKQIHTHLERCLIDSYIDEERIGLGASLLGSISAAIGSSDAFVAFLSRDYLNSKWCLAEYEQAEHLRMKTSLRLIIVLLEPREAIDNTLASAPLSDERRALLSLGIDRYLYQDLDPHRLADEGQKLADHLWQHEKLNFQPITRVPVGTETMQRIEFRTLEKTVPPHVLARIGLRIEERFLSRGPGEDRPLQVGEPVLLSGQGPNWLYTHLAIQFKNLCRVYVYNNATAQAVCVHDPRGAHLGQVIDTRPSSR